MKPRTTIVLVALALVALAAVVLWERELPGTDERREREGRLLPDVEAQSIDKIALARPGGGLVLERVGDDWWLREPVDDRADGYRVERLVEDVAGARVETRVPAEQVRGGDEATGLGGGALRVELTGPDTAAAVQIGTKAAPGGLRYARVEGDERLALVRESTADDLSVNADALRDRTLVDATTFEMRRLEVERDGTPVLELARGGPEGRGDAWWIVHPLEDEADGARVTALLSEIGALRAESFVDASPLDDGDFDPPAWRVAVELAPEDGEGEGEPPRSVELSVGRGGVADAPGLALARVTGRDALFEVRPGPLVAELERDAASLRSTTALELTTWDVEEVDVTRGGETVTVARVPGAFEPASKWRVVAPEGFELDAEAFDRALSELARVEALRLADDADPREAGLDAPAAALTVRYGGDDPRPPVTLEVGGPAGPGETWARRSGRDAILVVAEAIAEKIDTSRIRRKAD